MKHILYIVLFSITTLLSGCADAGSNSRVEASSEVTLDASQSTADQGGKISRYTWQQESGPEIQLSDIHAIQPTFTAPDVSEETTLLFSLITKESVEGIESDYRSVAFVMITIIPFIEEAIQNTPPHAVMNMEIEEILDMSKAIKIIQESELFLSAEDSSDEDGEILSYLWKDKEGNILGYEETLTHVFISLGVQSIELTVTDDDNASTHASLAFEVVSSDLEEVLPQ